MMLLRILGLAILTEALVELLFTAAPLQRIRTAVIRATPWLASRDQGHLLACKYCCSVWIAGMVMMLAVFADCSTTRMAAAAIVVHRISNYAHTMIGWIRDAQINKRLERK